MSSEHIMTLCSLTICTNSQVEDEDLPYYYALRNKDSMAAIKRIQQMSTMIVWSQDVHGIIAISNAPRKTLYRAKTEKPVRKKTPVQRMASLPNKSGDRFCVNPMN